MCKYHLPSCRATGLRRHSCQRQHPLTEHWKKYITLDAALISQKRVACFSLKRMAIWTRLFLTSFRYKGGEPGVMYYPTTLNNSSPLPFTTPLFDKAVAAVIVLSLCLQTHLLLPRGRVAGAKGTWHLAVIMYSISTRQTASFPSKQGLQGQQEYSTRARVHPTLSRIHG